MAPPSTRSTPHPPGNSLIAPFARKMEVRSQRLGRREGVTLSLLSAIMAPSLNTASSTIRMVGKYLFRWEWGRGRF